MSVILDAFERAELRSYLTDTLPSSCVVQAVADANGARTTIATVACRVVYPRSSEGAEYLGDKRVARVLLPPGTVTANADVIVVDGAASYRVIAQDPDRHDELLRAVSVVAADEPGGPV